MPKVTPLEIQNRQFSKKWRGIDAVEVEAFLSLVSEEIEDLTRAKAELESRVRALETENGEHRERERTLSRRRRTENRNDRLHKRISR